MISGEFVAPFTAFEDKLNPRSATKTRDREVAPRKTIGLADVGELEGNPYPGPSSRREGKGRR
jgi:hypothetical protein